MPTGGMTEGALNMLAVSPASTWEGLALYSAIVVLVLFAYWFFSKKEE